MNKLATTSIVIVVGLAVGGYIAYSKTRGQERVLYQDREVPPGGLVVNAAGRDHLGDPENAVADFRRIYAAMDGFRRANRRLPTLAELFDVSKPLAPGVQLTADDLMAPDAKYADGFVEGQKNLSSYMYAYMQPRPNGQAKPAFPAPGERDVWLVSTDYTRRNQIVYPDRHQDLDFRGTYVVLWSDGKIEQVPVLDGKFAVDGRNGTLTFTGQAGMSDKSKDLKEFFKPAEGKNNIRYNGS